MRLLKWLYPGMLVKRWAFLCVIGIIMIAMGFAIVISEQASTNITGASMVIIMGIAIVITSIKRMIKSFITVFLPKMREKELVDIIYKKRQLERSYNIVAMGGGHGLSTLLHGLKEYTGNITAIVTVADDGGSSGRLREELGVLPPGDIRNCIVALADAEPLMGRLFQFRFEGGVGLKGHNFGNLFITAMCRLTGDFEKAVKESSKILAIRGRVIPSTLNKVSLVAEYEDGTRVTGESKIPEANMPIKRLNINPVDSKPTTEAIEAIRKADIITLGPGSLYTSIMPNLLIKDLYKEIEKSKAIKIYICNVMTQSGETDNFTASDHIKTIVSHTSQDVISHCIVNTGKVPDNLLEKYSQEDAYPASPDVDEIKKMGYTVIESNIIDAQDYVRHDPSKLAKLIDDFAVGSAKNNKPKH